MVGSGLRPLSHTPLQSLCLQHLLGIQEQCRPEAGFAHAQHTCIITQVSTGSHTCCLPLWMQVLERLYPHPLASGVFQVNHGTVAHRLSLHVPLNSLVNVGGEAEITSIL